MIFGVKLPQQQQQSKLWTQITNTIALKCREILIKCCRPFGLSHIRHRYLWFNLQLEMLSYLIYTFVEYLPTDCRQLHRTNIYSRQFVATIEATNDKDLMRFSRIWFTVDHVSNIEEKHYLTLVKFMFCAENLLNWRTISSRRKVLDFRLVRCVFCSNLNSNTKSIFFLFIVSIAIGFFLCYHLNSF